MILIDSLSFFLLFFKYKGASILSDIHIVSTTSVRPQIFLEGFYWSHKTMDILRLVQWDGTQLKAKLCYWTTEGRQHAICFYSVDWIKLNMRHDLFDKFKVTFFYYRHGKIYLAPCTLYLRFSFQSRLIFNISYLISHRDIRSRRTMVPFSISIT